MTVELEGLKIARILAKPIYPPVSAWEFDFLKMEKLVQQRLNGSTIYLIVQRPMLWFDNVIVGESAITFEITDGSEKRLDCTLNPLEIGLAQVGESLDVQVDFHRNATMDKPPYRQVAGIRIYKGNEFKVWWSPQKLLFEAIVRDLPLQVRGDVETFSDFQVHYIGKAFSQPIWDRLSGHKKFQAILTREDVKGEGHSRPALEVSLITLNIFGLDELLMAPILPTLISPDVTPIPHRFRFDVLDPSFADFHAPWLKPGDAALTTEVEAMLINLFRPEYNSILYENYPKIQGGTRSAGYSSADLELHDFPFRLHDKSGRQPLVNEDDLAPKFYPVLSLLWRLELPLWAG
jgi:hypothetical protein